MSTISLLVPSHHTIFIDHLSYLFDPDDILLRIYTTLDYVSDLEAEGKRYYKRHEIITSNPAESYDAFVRRHFQTINEANLIFIPTLRNYFSELASMEWKSPILLGVHNMKYWFFRNKRKPVWQVPGLRGKLSAIKARFINTDSERAAFLKKVSFVNFHNPAIANYFAKNYPNHEQYGITLLPFTYYIPENDVPPTEYPADGDSYVFTIPGEIVEKRKNHIAIIRGFSAASQSFRRRVKVILLGRINGTNAFRNKVISECNSAKRPNLEFEYYTNSEGTGSETMLSERYFYDAVARTHCFVSAMKDNSAKEFHHYTEYFGQTSASGLSFDVIRYQRPCIIKAGHEYLKDIEQAVEIYHNDRTFTASILKMMDPDYLKQKREALDAVIGLYSKEEVLKRFREALKARMVSI